MDLGDVRDFVLVVWGIVSILLTLVVLAVMVAVLYFGRKGMKSLDRLTNVRLVGVLNRVQAINEKVRDRTAALPGAPGSTAGATELIRTVGEVRAMDPPFKRKTKSWRPL